MTSSFTEDHLIEQPATQLMEHELGWDSVHAYDEWALGASVLGRDAKREVVRVIDWEILPVDAGFFSGISQKSRRICEIGGGSGFTGR